MKYVWIVQNKCSAEKENKSISTSGIVNEEKRWVEWILDNVFEKKLQEVLQKIEESITEYPDMSELLENENWNVIWSFAGTEFSNMWRWSIKYRWVKFASTEHGYMYHKFDFDELEKYFQEYPQEFQEVRNKFINKYQERIEGISDDFAINNIKNLYTGEKYWWGFIKNLSKEFEILWLRIDNWDEIKLETLVGLNILKYDIPELRKKLLSTQWKTLIEWNDWWDVYWGIDINEKRGLNYLWRTLMIIRDEL